MSDLREQLQSERAKYHSQRYPGDLAAELLPAPRHTVLKIFTAAAAVSGIAAAILLWVVSRPLVTPPNQNRVVAVSATPANDDGEAVALPK
jgi:hypothetical protein